MVIVALCVFLTWSAPQWLNLDSELATSAVAHEGLTILLLLQACLLALVIPALPVAPRAPALSLSVAFAIILPLPLHAIFWLMSDRLAPTIINGQLALLGWAALVWLVTALARWGSHRLAGSLPALTALGTPCLQSLLTLFAYSKFSEWALWISS